MNTQTGNDEEVAAPQPLSRITRDPQVMEGRACIRGLRVTVGIQVISALEQLADELGTGCAGYGRRRAVEGEITPHTGVNIGLH